MTDANLEQMKKELDAGADVSYTDNLQATIEGLSEIRTIDKLGGKAVRDAQLDDQTSKVVLTLWGEQAENAQEGPVSIKYAYLKRDAQKGYVLNVQKRGSITYGTQQTEQAKIPHTPSAPIVPTTPTTERSRPIGHVKVGRIEATIWAKTLPQFNNREVRSVTVKRRYMDARNEWHDTNWFQRRDIPDLIIALQKAYERVATIKED